MQGKAVRFFVDLLVFLLHRLHTPFAAAEYLDVFKAVDAFEHQRLHFTETLAIPHTHAAPGFHRDKREDDAYDNVYRQKHRCKQRIEPKCQPQSNTGKNNDRKHRSYGMGKEKLYRFNIGHGYV